MGGEIPSRDGWVSGELADLPSCPPFPDLTDFEQKAPAAIAELFGPAEAAFREQIAACAVVDRINTVHGFFPRVAVDRSMCRPAPIRGKGATFEAQGVPFGLGVILWEKDGYLETIEGYTFVEPGLANVELARLRFSDVESLG